MLVTYELDTNEQGQRRAGQVAVAHGRAARPAALATGTCAIAVAGGFLALVAMLVFAGKLPRLVFGLYLGLSAVAFVAYALDKSAARHNRWRTRESTLHMLGLFGGWPGALLARHLLRHKSKKEAFRTVLWGTVVINCGALAWLLTPWGATGLLLLGAG